MWELVKLQGYKWLTESDFFAPGFSELNMNKKVRGGKKPNESPGSTYEDASHLLQNINLARRDGVRVASY